MDGSPITAYIAVGSNLGDRRATIHKAVERLNADPQINVLRISSLLNNPAVGGPIDSPDFLNGAIEVQTTLNAYALLQRLLQIERSLGRERRQKWAPRTIDLDLLLFGDAIIHDEMLIVPHPRLHERRFVLQPLLEISPKLRLPTTDEQIANLLTRVKN